MISKQKSKDIMDSLMMKAKFITLATFIGLCLICVLGLVFGLIFYPSTPFVILEGVGQIGNIVFQFFVVIASGVAVTGAGSTFLDTWRNGNGKNGSNGNNNGVNTQSPMPPMPYLDTQEVTPRLSYNDYIKGEPGEI